MRFNNISKYFPPKTALAGARGLFAAMLVCLAVILPGPAQAAATAAPSQMNDPVQKRPEPDQAAQANSARLTPVAVDQKGTDSLGSRVSYMLKENFNSGTLFALSAKDEPKLLVLMFTESEFPSRPGVGSIYSVIWVYSENPKVFPTYLDQMMGVITPDTVNDVVTRIAQKTDGVVARYSYIFKK